MVATAFAIANALVEEVAFRGIIQSALAKTRLSMTGAIVVQASLFRLLHFFGGVPSGATGFAMAGSYGGVLGVLRHLTGGLLLPWLAHVFADLAIFSRRVACIRPSGSGLLPLRPDRPREGAVDALERWLAPLGLQQLAPVLRANDIDLEILPELTETDLEKFGLSLGHRKKLLRAAASLAPAASSSAPSAELKPSQHAGASVERRQLTVMFCELVGSTALAARLDPEDLREVIGAYHRCVAETVARFDGFVTKYMGDGALVYFGYPRAHEADVRPGKLAVPGEPVRRV